MIVTIVREYGYLPSIYSFFFEKVPGENNEVLIKNWSINDGYNK